MRAHRTVIVSLILAAVLAVPAGAAAKKLILGGSTSVFPLAKELAAAYHKAYPNIAEPSVQAGASDIGITGVAEGRFDIGDSSRDPETEGEPSVKLKWHKIARDGVCIVTSKANPIGNLSQETVEGIFTGAIRDWSEVPGAKISGPIDLFDRTGASGTQDAFQHIFLGETQKITSGATAELSNGLEQTAVKGDKQAIGFVSFAYTAGINAVGYNGVACNLRNAKSNQYAGVRNFWMITRSPAPPAAQKFIEWVTSGKRTPDKIINSSWIAIK